MEDYETISEIVKCHSEGLNAHPPLTEWDIEAIETGLTVTLGDMGGRESYVANARVRVTEEDGTTWTGVTRIE